MHRRPLALLFGIALLADAAACAATGDPSARRNRNLITGEEMATVNAATAYEAIEQLRPEFLRTRGVTSARTAQADYAVVYINGLRAGALDTLRWIRADDVFEIRYVRALDATTRYGTGHTGGVIEVQTKR